MNCNAQPEVGSNPFIEFATQNLTVTDGGMASSLIVEENVSFDVSIDYALSGIWAGFLEGLLDISGSDAEFKVTAESLGPGPEVVLGTANVNFSAGTLSYTSTMTIAPNTLIEGAYKLTGLVTIPNFGPITGYCEGPVLQIKSA